MAACWKKSGDPAGRNFLDRLWRAARSRARLLASGRGRSEQHLQREQHKDGRSLSAHVESSAGRSSGDVLLAPGEANLGEQSVVNVSRVFTVNKQDLGGRIGALDPERAREVISGLGLLLEPRDIEV